MIEDEQFHPNHAPASAGGKKPLNAAMAYLLSLTGHKQIQRRDAAGW
jgi:hypothetical protein